MEQLEDLHIPKRLHIKNIVDICLYLNTHWKQILKDSLFLQAIYFQTVMCIVCLNLIQMHLETMMRQNWGTY